MYRLLGGGGNAFRDIERQFDNINIFTHLYRYYSIPAYKFLFWFRKIQDTKSKFIKTIQRLWFIRYSNRVLINIPLDLHVDHGLYLPHGGPVVINRSSKIRENLTIHPNTLIGGNRKSGAPTIGDNVFIGNGAKIIGNCKIGDWVFVSPAAVITKDIPSDSVVGAGLNNILRYEGGKENVMIYMSPNQKAKYQG